MRKIPFAYCVYDPYIGEDIVLPKLDDLIIYLIKDDKMPQEEIINCYFTALLDADKDSLAGHGRSVPKKEIEKVYKRVTEKFKVN